MNKGLFLDRDGTIIQFVDYIDSPEKVVLAKGAREGLLKALELGFLLFIHTNQSGVNRGYFTMETVHAINQRMLELLELPAGAIKEICIAPERPDEPPKYRKPSPNFINEMVEQYQLDKQSSYMIGDSSRDVEAAQNAGIHPVLIENHKIRSGERVEALKHGKVQRVESILEWANSL